MTGRLTMGTAMLVAAVLAFPGAASAWFAGVETVTAAAGAGSPATGSATTTCPAGKRVTGAGGDVTPGGGKVVVTAIRPNAALTSVTVTAAEAAGGTGEEWVLRAFAICAPAPAGLQRVSVTSATSSAAKVVAASCPAGTKVLGTGAEVTGAEGRVVLDGVKPASDLSSATVNAFEDEAGTASAWTATAHAVCGSPAQGVTRVAQTTAADSSSPRTAFAPCPAGKVAIGLGGEINGGAGQVVADALFPGFDERGPGFAAWEDATGYSGTWSVTAYTVCGAEVRSVPAGHHIPAEGGGVYALGGCADGTTLTATGWAIDGARGAVWLHSIFLDPGFSTPFLRSGGAESAPVVHRVCAGGLPTPQVIDAEAPEGAVGDFVQTATAVCPAGSRALSGAPRSGPEVAPYASAQALVPSADLTRVTSRAALLENSDTTDWPMTAQAVCAGPVPGLERVARTSPTDSEEYKTVVVGCRAGKHVLGMGATVSPGDGQVILDDLRPNAALTSVTLQAVEDVTGTSAGWSVTAYAVCANR